MRSKKAFDIGVDYNAFDSPYTGLATMIFAQAQNDLELLGGAEYANKGGSMVSKWEIINFLRSPWAEFLATSIGVETIELEQYTLMAAG